MTGLPRHTTTLTVQFWVYLVMCGARLNPMVAMKRAQDRALNSLRVAQGVDLGIYCKKNYESYCNNLFFDWGNKGKNLKFKYQEYMILLKKIND